MPPVPPARPVPALSVRGLRKTYGERTVLDGIDLDVAPGTLVAVLGANGSGKSTLLRCAARLERPDSGEILLHGMPIAAGHEPHPRDRRTSHTGGPADRRSRRTASADRRPHRTAMIFQQIHLVRRRSALDNVCAGALGRLSLGRSLSPLLFPQDLRREAMTCLDRVAMADRAAEPAARLSGGQQQRVAIARALCQRADILLADEPVAALDPAAARAVLGLLAELAHDDGLAVLVVLHQPDLALTYADRIVGMQDGRIRLDARAASLSFDRLQTLYSASPAPHRTAGPAPVLPVASTGPADDSRADEARTDPEADLAEHERDERQRDERGWGDDRDDGEWDDEERTAP